MSDAYVQFSCLLPVGAGNAEAALAPYGRVQEEHEAKGDTPGFETEARGGGRTGDAARGQIAGGGRGTVDEIGRGRRRRWLGDRRGPVRPSTPSITRSGSPARP